MWFFCFFFFVKVRPLFPYPHCGPGATDTQKGCHWFTAPFMHDYKVTPPLSQISGNYKQRLQYVSPTIVAASIPCGMGHSTLVGTSSMGGTLQVQAENLSGSVLPFQEVMTPSTHTHTHTTPNSHFTTIQPPQGCPALAVVPSWTLLLSSYLDSDSPRVQVHSHILYQLVTDTGNLRDTWNRYPIRKRPYQTMTALSFS